MTEYIKKNSFLLSLCWIISALFLFSCIYIIQHTIDTSYSQDKEERLLYLPSGKYLKPLCLGYEAFVSDLLWLKAISYFGGHYLTDRSYKWLYHILDLVTTLDPQFRYPYEFGGIILTIESGNYEKGTALLLKGITYYPDYWRLYFYLGFNYLYYHKDTQKAAYYMTEAARLPGHPEYLPKLAASLLTQAGKKETALSFLKQLYDTTDDVWLREQIQNKINEILSGRLPETLKGIFQE
jgi:tetratricopeptide (TPR) repeat protein